jgi:hypothetical protein
MASTHILQMEALLSPERHGFRNCALRPRRERIARADPGARACRRLRPSGDLDDPGHSQVDRSFDETCCPGRAGGECFYRQSQRSCPQSRPGTSWRSGPCDILSQRDVCAVVPQHAAPAKLGCCCCRQGAPPGQLPAAAAANCIVVTGLVVGIDLADHSLQLIDPSGGEVHTVTVIHPQRQRQLGRVKVGDKITAYMTEALLISVDRI